MKIEDIYNDLPVLETSRTILRKIEKNDVQDIYSYCSDPEVSKYTTWHPHMKIEDTENFVDFIIDKYNKSQISPWGIQDKKTDKIIGTCDFVGWDINHHKAEIGYALSRDYWGQGYMTECVKKIIEFGFEHMDLVRIEARCISANTGSSRVMEKSGMEFEGVFRKHVFIKGKFEDLKMYSIINEKSAKRVEDNIAIR
ncbi:ribosomal-protein-alanine N-acetyltransferase [Paenibacillus sp. 4624]|uniref:GNAT family N-acetyltransferase n=1 Tax=Paenibacillus amylolyticus TaxID=1451 RepID=A0A5M9X140_PAEAM|nr:GNAT family protein [Paenibacillus amylolyticus]KAA8787565.1 GNAT family N-acetyltransferase [Paenibacillus amylolyticus]